MFDSNGVGDGTVPGAIGAPDSELSPRSPGEPGRCRLVIVNGTET